MGTAAVTMGMLTVAGAFAPAALAVPPDTTGEGTTLPAEEESAGTAEVLTSDPVPAAATPAGAHYGIGKHTIQLAGADDHVPDGASIDPTGAQVTMTFSKQNDVPKPASSTCTFTSVGPFGLQCSFPPAPDFPPSGIFGSIELPAGSEFTLELVKQPTSGQLLVLEGSSPTVLEGYTTDSSSGGPLDLGSFVLSAPGGYRTLGVTVNGTGDRAGSTFALCTIPGSTCTEQAPPVGPDPFDPLLGFATPAGLDPDLLVSATTDAQGRATFDGIYRPGTYTVVQTAAPAGQSFDATPGTLVVAAATSLADRDVPVRLAVGEPVEVDTPDPTTPPVTSTPPVSTPPAGTPATSTPSTSTPAGTPVTSTVAVPQIVAGKQQTVTIGGFQPYEMVHGVLRSTPVDLGTVQADANGNATFTFTVPAGLETGTHSVTMTGLTSGTEQAVTFTVTAPAAATGGLAYTGSEVVPLVALGGGLLVAGAGAVTVARRRRTA